MPKMMTSRNRQIKNGNAWKLSRRSRKGPEEVPGELYIPHVRNIFQSNFIIFARNMPKNMSTTNRKFMSNIL